MISITTILKRGLLAGLIAGIAAIGFSYFLAEPLMDKAIDIESARSMPEEAQEQAAGSMVDHHMELFSRSTQRAGFILATALTGLALGMLFAVVYWVLFKRDTDKNPWNRSVYLAAATFASIWLIPFLRYPSNPPGVGDPATVDFRTNIWLGAHAIAIVAVLCAWMSHRYLSRREVWVPLRQLAVAGLLVAGLAMSFLLPGNPDEVGVPATLLWNFRLVSLSTALVMWAALGITFGLLSLRAAAKMKGRRWTRPDVGGPLEA